MPKATLEPPTVTMRGGPSAFRGAPGAIEEHRAPARGDPRRRFEKRAAVERPEPLDVAGEDLDRRVALEVGEVRIVEFDDDFWTVSEVGNYTVTATTKLPGDENPTNDVVGPEHFLVVDAPPGPPGWAEVDSMPSAPSGKAVKTFLGPVTRASIENYLESVSE